MTSIETSHLPSCCGDGCSCNEIIADYVSERAISDARGTAEYERDAAEENLDRDWTDALHAHDRFINQCEGRDRFGARCLNRKGHRGAHEANLNAMLKFAYSEPRLLRAIAFDVRGLK